jgi:hypothetical protein
MKSLIVPLVALLTCAALGACATDIPPATAIVDGALTAAPAGWTSYCDRHVEDAGCRR